LETTAKDYLSEICLFSFGLLTAIFSNKIIDPSLIKSDQFKTHSFLYQGVYIFIYSISFRLRYMVVWGLNNLSVLIAGIRSVELNEKGTLGPRLRNINWCKVEMGFVTRDRISNWNLGTNKWLRICFYDKFLNHFNLKKTQATMFTFGMSAIWHGLYPAYYISFFFWQILLKVDRSIYKLKNILIQNKVYPVFLFIVFYLMNIPGAIFMNILLHDTWAVTYNLRYWLFLIILFWLSLKVAVKVLVKKPKSKEKKQ
jgi:lysophospholipid acyltransferase